MRYIICTLILSLSCLAYAKDPVLTNAAIYHNVPKWFKASKAEAVSSKIEYKLEWSTRRVNVFFYSSWKKYLKQHRFGKTAVAVTVHGKKTSSIHMSPRVNVNNYQQILGHEFVHVVLRQKYKKAVPKWLEEGLANHLAGLKNLDYKKLKNSGFKVKVAQLAHPYGGPADQVSLKYRFSQALAEMLDRKCGLDNLLRLSVERKLESYIKTYCEIHDLDKSLDQWIAKKSS